MLASVRGELWAMNPDQVQHFAVACLDAAEKAGTDLDLEDFFDPRQVMSIDGSGIATIHIKGALLNKAPRIYETLGLATKYQAIIDETNAAVSAGATGIVYMVDSPGGTVAGCMEAASVMSKAPVRTAAVCTGLACSAAYWLTSQTGLVVAAPSAEVGNVGAILSWADCSAFWKDMGVEFKALVNDGAELKSTFHLEPDATQLAFLQDRINEAGAAFQDAVIYGRATANAVVDVEVWKAGWYSGEKAVALGLVDDIGGIDIAVEFLTA